MTDLGVYRTFDNRCYRCRFDRENRAALAFGPLPLSYVAVRMIATSVKEAAENLSRFIGRGMYTRPVQKWE